MPLKEKVTLVVTGPCARKLALDMEFGFLSDPQRHLMAIGYRVAEAVHEALWTLPEVQRVAITLMDLAGFTAKEVAGFTGAPRGTVLARVHRGRKALATVLRVHAPEDPQRTGTERTHDQR